MIGWLDASAGASGDMLLGALVDAGVPLAHLQSTVDALELPERPVLRAEPVRRQGLGATSVTVTAPDAVRHRTLPDIRDLLPGHPTALAVFELLARAEAAVHRIAPERVHFHEVGALDAIADVVGACAGVDWLAVHRGLETIHCGPIEIGGSGAPDRPGAATTAGHGAIPVPAPAVLEVLRLGGRTVTGRLPHEACTPTGAALLATLTREGPLPAMRIEAVGVGAGGRDPAEAPNLLRLVLGEPPVPTEVVLECNTDDLDPRLWPAVLAALLDAGASDAWLTPILMKKGRPAHTLHVLAPPAAAERLRTTIFRHTSTIGLRQYPIDKHALARTWSTVDVDGQPVRVKLASLGGEVVNVSVEYEDVTAAAAALGVPVKVVLARASAAAVSAPRSG
jgi:pyridinium-3,5-bisthiocarboxylic acid mononucleotide nickel chelatase